MTEGKQNQELEEIEDGYYKIEINKQNLVSAYESTRLGSNEVEKE